MDPVIKFEANPTPEEVANADANGHATIPTTSGVVIVLESDTSDKAKPKAKGKKRRHEEPEVEVISGPSVRFPDYLNTPPPVDSSMLNLRKHVMIAQINYYNSSTRFFDQASALLPHVKRMIADMPFSKKTEGTSTQQTEHGYAFPSGSNGYESDCDV